jgi:hypothetical protein
MTRMLARLTTASLAVLAYLAGPPAAAERTWRDPDPDRREMTATRA